MSSSADELNPPSWLNSEFFLEVIRNFEKEDAIVLEKFEILPACAKNDQYASVIFRIVVTYSVNDVAKEKSMILKTMPEMDLQKKEFLKNTHIFETETSVYIDVIPKFEEILRAVGDNTKFAPRCLYHSSKPKEVIIFEDMIPHGYTVLSKRQTNFDESKAVYEKIAKFHALSYKLNLEEPELFENLHHNMFYELKYRENEFCKDGVSNFLEMLDEHDDLRHYKKYFEPFEFTILDKVEDIFNEKFDEPQSELYRVLCHGDFHHRNLLFKYDEQSSDLMDVQLIDFQMAGIGANARDILYSKFLMIDDEQRVENFDKLLEIYLSTFQETLNKIGFKGRMPNMIGLRKQILAHRCFALFFFTSFLPVLEATYRNEFDFGELLFSKDVRKSVFKSAIYVNEVRKFLPKCKELGYLKD